MVKVGSPAGLCLVPTLFLVALDQLRNIEQRESRGVSWELQQKLEKLPFQFFNS